MLEQVSETQRGVGWTLRGDEHVDGPATPEVDAVDRALTGLQELPNGRQPTVKTGHMESWMPLWDEAQKKYVSGAWNNFKWAHLLIWGNLECHCVIVVVNCFMLLSFIPQR